MVKKLKIKALTENDTPYPENNASSPIYSVHGHYAKRPFNVVNKCIQHFTKKGDIVLDPFGGFGTTGLESLVLRRKAVILDVNPVSIFMTKSILETCTPKDLEIFEQAVQKLILNCKKKSNALYAIQCDYDHKSEILSTILDSTNDEADPRNRNWEVKSITYYCPKCKSKSTRNPTKKDLSNIKEIQNTSTKYWVPTAKLIVNSQKSVYENMTVSDFFTKRNLTALAILKHEIDSLPNNTISSLLRFTFSAILRSAAMFVHKGGGGWSNSFHVPKKGLAERNVYEMFARKSKIVKKCKLNIISSINDYSRITECFDDLSDDATIMIKNYDATQLLDIIPKKQIDYLHTDPPYGDNMQYLELFLPHIDWLGFDLTKKMLEREIVITDSPEIPDKRTTKNYHNLLVESFRQAGLTLKDNHWGSIWFACQDEDIWEAFTESIRSAGLEQKKTYLIPRTAQQKSFGIKRQKAIDPLSEVLDEDLLVHGQKTGAVKLQLSLLPGDAMKLFVDVAASEIKKKGSVSTGEIYLAFVNKCLNDYNNPPPSLDYTKLLESDSSFVITKSNKKVGKKSQKVSRWTLQGQKNPRRRSTN